MQTDLTALKEALAKMTPGVWYEEDRKIYLYDASGAPIAEVFGYQQAHDDAKGIVLLHNSADAMIARIEALEAENARLRNIVIDAMEIIEDQLPGEFIDWENRAYNAINYGAA